MSFSKRDGSERRIWLHVASRARSQHRQDQIEQRKDGHRVKPKCNSINAVCCRSGLVFKTRDRIQGSPTFQNMVAGNQPVIFDGVLQRHERLRW